ncbi:MAG: circularly permuted type 2 ATP-grasp protein [Candidatus Hinthialibacter antarcticus]|nr:circularly permuted type 2 ATP-grasp protein [Candidatus Hinthialibacter antarcticus]
MMQQQSNTPGAVYTPYTPVADHFDEWFDETGAVRPHCQFFHNKFLSLDSQKLNEIWNRAKRTLYENGIVYNIYNEDRDHLRPWLLDPIPMILANKDWLILQEGLRQRAHLLNQLAIDLYGPQQVIRERRLPHEFIFANPGFIRACSGIHPTRGIWIHRYASDLARRPDGSWVVLSDRTQTPAGSGYALENRIVLNRLYPSITQNRRIHRLASYFKTFLESIVKLLPPARQEDPQIVLLSPGPVHDSYFEHSYLAKYLGITLVEGADLTVRSDKVFIKTLEGLKQVDAIIRRIDDWESDQLFCNSSGSFGVPGLIQAARAENVLVVNAIGSGVLESPMLAPYLPELCRHYLAEDLKLPTVQTWWCGTPDGLAYALDHFDSLIIKSAFPRLPFVTISGDQLSQQDRSELIEKIKAKPYQFVVQEKVNLSTAPVWTGTQLEARNLIIRMQVVTQAKGGFDVMAGGLTRVSSAFHGPAKTQDMVGAFKDTWVMSDKDVEEVSLLSSSSDSIVIRRAPRNIPSRLADNLFWLSRYLERSEFALRSIRMLLSCLSDRNDNQDSVWLNALLNINHVLFKPSTPLEEMAPYDADGVELFARTLIFDSEQDHSIAKNLDSMRFLTWKVRDRISSDAWRILAQLENLTIDTKDSQGLSLGEIQDLLNQMLTCLAAFSGLEMESMTRAMGWRFLDMGRRIERMLNTMSVLKSALNSNKPIEINTLLVWLELFDCSMTYRSRYVDDVQLGTVVDLILFDETNPRSVCFQVAQLAAHIDLLPNSQNRPLRTLEQRIALETLTKLRLFDIDTLSNLRQGDSGSLADLLEFLDHKITILSDALSITYFSHATQPRLLAKQQLNAK